MASRAKRLDQLPPNSKHKSVEEYEDTLAQVAEWMTRGVTATNMIKRLWEERRLKVSHVTVYNYIKIVRERWRQPTEQVREDHIILKRKQLEMLYAEAMWAWEHSKKQEVTRTVEKVVPLKLSKGKDQGAKVPQRLKDAMNKFGQERDEDGNPPAPGTAEADLMVVKETIRTADRLPSGQFLQIALMCIAAERELMGLDAVIGREDGGKTADGKTKLTWTQRMQALPAKDEIEELITSKQQSKGKGTLANKSILGEGNNG